MEIDRRKFIHAGLLLSAEMMFPPSAMANGIQEDLFASARRETSGTFSAALFNSSGDVRVVTLPGRGHDFAIRPAQETSPKFSEVVIFARRPGRFAVAFSQSDKRPALSFFAKENRHFYGHGIFSPDGRLLYTTENDFENGVGVIGVRDATDGYRQIAEFSSHGIGPHDMALLDDGVTLVIANGGMETSPDMGRQVLNLASMQPSLVYIDCRSGDLLEKQVLPSSLHQLSIRHLTVAGNNRVMFGCQYKGPKTDDPKLIGFHDRGSEVQLVAAPPTILRAMKNYVGSITADRSGQIIAASSPRGGIITYWDAINKNYLGSRQLKDGCGIARTHRAGEFLLTNGLGLAAITSSNNFDKLKGRSVKVQWDNHAVLVR